MNWKDRATQVICEAMKGMKTTKVEGPKAPVTAGKRRATAAIRYTTLDPDALVASRTHKLGGDIKGAKIDVKNVLDKIRTGKLKGDPKRTFMQRGSQALGRGVPGLEQDPPPIDPIKKVEPGGTIKKTGRPRGTPNR